MESCLPRRSNSARIRGSSVRFCLPPIHSTPSYDSETMEAQESRIKRRRTQQFKAFEFFEVAPPASRTPTPELLSREEMPASSQHAKFLTRGAVLGSLRHRKRRADSDSSTSSSTLHEDKQTASDVPTVTSDHTAFNKATGADLDLWKAADQFYLDAGSRSILLLDSDSTWSTWRDDSKAQRRSQQLCNQQQTGVYPKPTSDPFVMTKDPLLLTDDPWSLPSMDI